MFYVYPIILRGLVHAFTNATSSVLGNPSFALVFDVFVKGYFCPFFFVSNKPPPRTDNSGNAIVMKDRALKVFLFLYSSCFLHIHIPRREYIYIHVETDAKLMRYSTRSGVSPCIDGATDVHSRMVKNLQTRGTATRQNAPMISVLLLMMIG